MLTKFGKTVRKLRIDKGDRLKDMAESLGKTSAYVSAVETGKKHPTDYMVRKIAAHYSLTPDQSDELEQAAAESRGEVIIPMKGLTELQRKAAAAFGRRLSDLTDDELKQILELL
jgi:transcriptional regulator with XRE-family HTH domain